MNVVIINGPMGVGKTTVGKYIAKLLTVSYITVSLQKKEMMCEMKGVHYETRNLIRGFRDSRLS